MDHKNINVQSNEKKLLFSTTKTIIVSIACIFYYLSESGTQIKDFWYISILLEFLQKIFLLSLKSPLLYYFCCCELRPSAIYFNKAHTQYISFWEITSCLGTLVTKPLGEIKIQSSKKLLPRQYRLNWPSFSNGCAWFIDARESISSVWFRFAHGRGERVNYSKALLPPRVRVLLVRAAAWWCVSALLRNWLMHSRALPRSQFHRRSSPYFF